MTPATYIGPRAHLRGKTALTRPYGSKVLAQFDDTTLTADGNPMPQQLAYEPHARFPTYQDCDNPPPTALGFGWHIFSAKDFQP